MHYRKLSAAILLTCSAGMFPVYAAEIKEVPAADTHVAASVTDKHVARCNTDATEQRRRTQRRASDQFMADAGFHYHYHSRRNGRQSLRNRG